MAAKNEKGTGEPLGGRRRGRALFVDGVILLLLGSFFLLLKSYSLNPTAGDENIWFYSAYLMSEGYMPYRDFFFAHPPLHLVPGGLLLLLTDGFQLETMKMLPVVAAAATGVCVYGIARRVAGVVAAAVTCALFFFSHDLLRASSHWTGINWSVAWMTGGMLAALYGRSVLAGVLLGLGFSTGVYVLPGAAIVSSLLFLVRPKAGLRCAVALTATWGLISIAFWIIGGSGYIDGVYRYHFLKPELPGAGFFDQIDSLLFHNFFVLAAPLFLFPVLVVWALKTLDSPGRQTWQGFFDPARHPKLATGLWCTLVWLGYGGFLSLLGGVFHYYFLLLFPAGAICGGLYASRLLSNVASARRSRPAAVGAAVMAALIAIGFIAYPRFERKLEYYERNVGKTKKYDLPPSVLPRAIQAPFQALFWNEERTVGERYTGILYYLWHESRIFGEVEEIVGTLRARVRQGETIFGDSTSTPLVSLLANVPIVDHFVDTNGMRFHSGLPTVDDAVAQLKAALDREEHPLGWVLISPGTGVGSEKDPFEPLRRFYREYFREVATFRTSHHGTYVLMERSDRA